MMVQVMREAVHVVEAYTCPEALPVEPGGQQAKQFWKEPVNSTWSHMQLYKRAAVNGLGVQSIIARCREEDPHAELEDIDN